MSDSEPTGFVFAGGSVIGSGTGISLLGRGYRPCSRVIFFKTNLGSVVQPVGWDAWSAKNNVYDPSVHSFTIISSLMYT